MEDEKHVLILCPVNTSIRAVLYEKATEICHGFPSFTDENKFNFILSNADLFDLLPLLSNTRNEEKTPV